MFVEEFDTHAKVNGRDVKYRSGHQVRQVRVSNVPEFIIVFFFTWNFMLATSGTFICDEFTQR